MSILKAGAARAIINPPLTIEQGVWGAKSHVTPSAIAADLWATCLVLDDGASTGVLFDLDLGSMLNPRAARLRERVAEVLGIAAENVRVSVTHTHAGSVLRADQYSSNQGAENDYLNVLIEQCVGIALQAVRALVPVAVHAGYGLCHMGKNRRQQLDNGLMVAGYNPDGEADPTVAVVRFDDERGDLVASIVHYAAHPTTLGYTNDLVSPDYPGVTKRFIEQNLGGTCLFLQGAAGDIGPGPGGFLSNVDAVHSIGTQLGCAATQTLLEARENQFDYRFAELVRSGADLGVWSRTRRPVSMTKFTVSSQLIALPLQEQPAPEDVRRGSDELFRRVTQLKVDQAGPEEIRDASFRLRRSNMALQRSLSFHGKASYDVEVHTMVIGDVAIIGIPIEPFSETGKTIRRRSPFKYTLFGGYANGANGYLPTPEAAAIGGYEVDQMAFAHNAADLLTERAIKILNQLAT